MIISSKQSSQPILFPKIVLILLGVLIFLGIVFRFYHITDNHFILFDEGMWLNANRGFTQMVEMHYPSTISEYLKILKGLALQSLPTGKALWAFVAGLRVFFVGANGWYFVRLVSAVFGVGTIGVTYLFARKYFGSKILGLLTAAILAFLPSHIYYSRLGIQESLAAFLFLCGMYFYFFPRKFSYRTVLSGFFFACVFFASYRMIIIPIIIFLSEVYISFTQESKINWRKYIYNTLTFFSFVFLIGGLGGGGNTFTTFGWMFHQSHLAKGHFEFLNLLSYPYYIFSFETFFFGVLFFANIYLIFNRRWNVLYPFLLVCLLMGIFSLPQEKGVRYLCVAMPFMALGVTAVLGMIISMNPKPSVKRFLFGFVGLMFVLQGYLNFNIVRFSDAYESSMKDLYSENKKEKILSTQYMVQLLYADNPRAVKALGHNINSLIMDYKRGYRYVIIDPQAYISYTEDDLRFTPQLEGFLQFILENVPPTKEYDHFNPDLLKRFVLEHNESLKTSLTFLKDSKEKKYGRLRVYEVEKSLAYLRYVMLKGKNF